MSGGWLRREDARSDTKKVSCTATHSQHDCGGTMKEVFINEQPIIYMYIDWTRIGEQTKAELMKMKFVFLWVGSNMKRVKVGSKLDQCALTESNLVTAHFRGKCKQYWICYEFQGP